MAVWDIQAEFFVPLEHAQDAIRAVWGAAREWSFSSPWGDSGLAVKGLVDAMEFRQVKGEAGDSGDGGGWLSPQPVDSLGIHISFNGDPALRAEVLRALPVIEEALEPYAPRHHWGKLAQLTASPFWVATVYGERLRKFRALAALHDPSGKFRNAHVQSMLFAGKAR